MGYKKIPTKDLTRLEWLELRREGIGGSDASVVMGENPYRVRDAGRFSLRTVFNKILRIWAG